MLDFSHYEKRIFEEMVLRNLPGPKRKGIAGQWRKLQNEVHTMYTPHQIFG